MGKWSFTSENGDAITVKEASESVCLYGYSTSLTEADLIINLPPDKAKELAQWLVLYANACDK